jgi:hypothetical protein
MASTPEGRVKAAVRKWLEAHGVWYYMPVSNGMGQAGIPDFVCCWQGYFLTIECKAPGKLSNTTANQDRVMEEIRSHGGFAIVVDDVSQLGKVLLWMRLTSPRSSLSVA